MAEDLKEIGTKEESSKAPNGFFSFLRKFELRLPSPRQDSKPELIIKSDREAVADAGEESIIQKPDFVSFPKANMPVSVSPLEAEAEVSGKTSNPAVLWQVYALGGFLILNWAWARWKERRPRQRSDDDDDDRNSSDI